MPDPTPPEPTRRRFGRAAVPVVPANPAATDPGVYLLPDPATPGAWQLARRGEAPTAFPTLLEAAAALALGEGFTLAMPLELGLVARYRLPEAPAAELADMARIQLEKVLPYADDDLGLACVPLDPAMAGEEGERSVAAYAVHRRKLAELCAPLGDLGRWPQRTVFAVQVRAAAAQTGGDTALLAYPEWGRVVVAVLEHGRPTFAQTLPADLSPDGLAGELPPLLLGAELEGVPTDFQRLALADDLPAPWAEAFPAVLPVPVTAPVPLLGPVGDDADDVDLSLPGWRQERRRAARAGNLRRRLGWAAAVYFALLLLGFADLARLRYLRNRYDRTVRNAQKPIAAIEIARKHWQALSPAFDYRLSAVEILDQFRQCLPADEKVDLRLTLFEINRLRSPAVLTVTGEAPSYGAATELGDRLKNHGELRALQLAPETPRILANGRASFQVVGRLP